MKNLILTAFFTTLLVGINFSAALANEHYVTFVIDQPNGNVEKVIYYPKGTTYRVYLTRKLSETIKEKDATTYHGDMHLAIYPSYNNHRPDDLTIEGKRLRIYETPIAAKKAGFGGKWAEKLAVSKEVNDHKSEYSWLQKELEPKNTTESIRGVTLVKELIPSKNLKGKYNLNLKLSNGITFEYEDGKYAAKLNGEYVNIEGKYIVETKIGTLKFSFNPNNGVVWWYFENKKMK